MGHEPADPRVLDARARHLLRTLIAEPVRTANRSAAARWPSVPAWTSAGHHPQHPCPTSRTWAGRRPASLGGRVPTAQGYRVFVDSLLQLPSLPEPELARLRASMPSGGGTQSLLATPASCSRR